MIRELAGVWKVAGVLTLLAAMGGSLAWGAGDYSVETASTEVPAMVSGGTVAKCPRGSALTGGGYATGVDSALVRNFFPSSRRRFAASMQNYGSGERKLTVRATCDATGRYRIRAKEATIPAQVATDLRARCPRGSRVSGGGVRAIGTESRVFGSRPAGRRSWLATTRFFGPPEGETTAIVYAVCDLAGGDYDVQAVSTTPPPVRALRRGVNAKVTMEPRCHRGSRLTGGGFRRSTGSGTADAVASVPDGRAWRVVWDTYAGKDLDFRAYAICKRD